MLDAYKKLAKQLIALKSVSAEKEHQEDCAATAKFLGDLLTSYGFTTKIIAGYGNPVVFATYEVSPQVSTCLYYGHYDVQPASKEDGWKFDPFVLQEKEDRLYGRGIMDDKGQLLMHILVIGKLIKERKLGYNVTFLFEGNEEVGSPFIEKFIQENTSLLSCDFIMLSDGEMVNGKPTIELGNRGTLNMTITLQTSHNELHSGIYGGVAPNAVHELTRLITSLHDANHTITIKGFYDEVEQVEKNYQIPFSFDEYKKNTGTRAILTEPEYDFAAQTGLRPSLTVTGLFGGYIKEGHKTIVPAKASAKLNFRLVKNQNPEKIGNLVKKHIEEILPDYVDVTITVDELASPHKTDANNSYVKKAEKVLEKVCGEKPVYKYVGGTEPVLLYLQNALNKPILSIPFANEDGFMHGIHENFTLGNIEKGIAFSKEFFEKNQKENN